MRVLFCSLGQLLSWFSALVSFLVGRIVIFVGYLAYVVCERFDYDRIDFGSLTEKFDGGDKLIKVVKF